MDTIDICDLEILLGSPLIKEKILDVTTVLTDKKRLWKKYLSPRSI